MKSPTQSLLGPDLGALLSAGPARSWMFGATFEDDCPGAWVASNCLGQGDWGGSALRLLRGGLGQTSLPLTQVDSSCQPDCHARPGGRSTITNFLQDSRLRKNHRFCTSCLGVGRVGGALEIAFWGKGPCRGEWSQKQLPPSQSQ